MRKIFLIFIAIALLANDSDADLQNPSASQAGGRCFQVGSTSVVSNPATSDAVMTGMTITPNYAGIFMAFFSTSVTGTVNNQDVSMTLYVNGNQQGNTVRVARPQIQGGLTPNLNITQTVAISGCGTLTAAGQAMDIRWQSATIGGVSVGSRQLTVCEVASCN